jgi:hypothetical protein
LIGQFEPMRGADQRRLEGVAGDGIAFRIYRGLVAQCVDPVKSA